MSTIRAAERYSRSTDGCLRWDMRRDMPTPLVLDFEERLKPDPARPIARDTLPDAGTWAANLTRGIIEVLLGRRPIMQLRRWVVPGLYDQIDATDFDPGGALPARRTSPAPCRVMSVSTCAIKPGTGETTVVFAVCGRIRAAALRLEDFRGRWLATALDII